MPKHTDDPLERLVADTLDNAGIPYTCPDQDGKNGGRLDFYLPKVDIYIECKAYGTARTRSQIDSVDNCIVLVGLRATQLFCALFMFAGRHGRLDKLK